MNSAFFRDKAYSLSRREASIAHHTDLVRQKVVYAVKLIGDMHRAEAEGIYSTPPSEPPLGFDSGVKQGISFVPVMQPIAPRVTQEFESVSSEWETSDPEPDVTAQDSGLVKAVDAPVTTNDGPTDGPTNDGPAKATKHDRPSAPQACVVQDIYCICRSPARGRMIECEKCSEWFHFRCVSLKKKVGPRFWRCPKCR